MNTPVVIDTNVALDLLLFDDPAVLPLQQALDSGALAWLATAAMREELLRVLSYPRIVPQLSRRGLRADAVLAAFDRQARLVDAAAACGVACEDPDDQPFVDLAVAHRCRLLSKDAAVLATAGRLRTLGAQVSPALA